MNNIVAKNIINGVVSRNDLPYSRPGEVGVRYNQTVSESINDSFNKLVENDLFIERQLNDVNNYEKGPKTYSEQLMRFGADGTKTWNDDLLDSPDTQISILHKYVLPVSSTLSASNVESRVNFIRRAGNVTFVGTDDGLYTQKTLSGISEWTTISSGALSAEKCNACYADDEQFLVAGESGVYSLLNFDSVRNMQNDGLEFARILDGKGVSGVCVGTEKDGRHVWTAEADGLRKDGADVFDVLGDSLSNVENVVWADGAAYSQTPNAVYSTYKARGFSGMEAVQGVQAGSLIDVVVCGGSAYALDASGLVRIDGQSSIRIQGFAGKAVGIAVCGERLYAASDSAVYLLTENGLSPVKAFNEIRDVNSLDDVLYVVDDFGLHTMYDGNWFDDEFGGGRLLLKCRNDMYLYSEQNGQTFLTYVKPSAGGRYVLDESNPERAFDGKLLHRTVVYDGSAYYATDRGILDQDFKLFDEDWDFRTVAGNGNYLFAVVVADGDYRLAYCDNRKKLSGFKLVPNLDACRYMDTYDSWLVFSDGASVNAVDIDGLQSLNDIGDSTKWVQLQAGTDSDPVKGLCFVKNADKAGNIYVFRESGTYNWSYTTKIIDLSVDVGESPSKDNPISSDFIRYFSDIDKDTQLKDIIGAVFSNISNYIEKTAVFDSKDNVYCIIRPDSGNETDNAYNDITAGQDYKYRLKQVYTTIEGEDDDQTVPLTFKNYKFPPVYLTLNVDLPDEYNEKDLTATTLSTADNLPIYTCNKISSWGIYDNDALLAVMNNNRLKGGSIIWSDEDDPESVNYDDYGMNFILRNDSVGLVSMRDVNAASINSVGIVFYENGDMTLISAGKSNEKEDSGPSGETPVEMEITLKNGSRAWLSGEATDFIAALSCFSLGRLPVELGDIKSVQNIASDSDNQFIVVSKSGKAYLYRGYEWISEKNEQGELESRKKYFNQSTPEPYAELSNFTEITFTGVPTDVVEDVNSQMTFGPENTGLAVWIKLGTDLYFGNTGENSDISRETGLTASMQKTSITKTTKVVYYYQIPYMIGNFGLIREIREQLDYYFDSQSEFMAERLEQTEKHAFAWDSENRTYNVPDFTSPFRNTYTHVNFGQGKFYLMDGRGLSAADSPNSENLSKFQSVDGKNVVDVAFSKSGREKYAIQTDSGVQVYSDVYRTFMQYTASGSLSGIPGAISKHDDRNTVPYVWTDGRSGLETLDVQILSTEISCTRSPVRLRNGNDVETAGDKYDVDVYGGVYTKSGEKLDVPFDFSFERNGYCVMRRDGVSSFCSLGELGEMDRVRPVIENVHGCRGMRLLDDTIIYMSDNGVNVLYPQTNSTALRTRFDARDANLVADSDDNGQRYVMFDDFVYTIDQNFRKKSMSAFVECPDTYALQKNSNYEYLLGTKNGLKYTEYTFQVKDDLSLCSTADVEGVLREKYQDFIDKHVRESHGLDDPITKVNDGLMPRNCSVLDGVMGNAKIQNIVESVEFDGYIPYVRAAVEFKSPLSVYNDDDISAKWIFRKYMKNREGELFIYLPTTNTRYVNHVDEIDSCQMLEDEFTRENTNLRLSRSIYDNTTYLSVTVDKEHFKIDSVYFQQINGNSLPLDVYRDFANRGKCGNTRFSTVVKQSSVVSPNYVEDNGNLVLRYICFGSDAQALHLLFNFYIDYTIEFDGNGHEDGEMDAQKCRSSEKIKLNPCGYRRNGYIFLGWSRDRYASEPEFLNNEEVYNLTDKENDVVTLFAVWQLYRFNNGATVLKIKADADPINLDYAERTEDSSNVFVDYDYSVDTILRLKSNGLPFSIAHGVGLENDSIIAIDFDYHEDEDKDDEDGSVSGDMSSDISSDISSNISADQT